MEKIRFKGTASEIAASEKTGDGGELVVASDTGRLAVADGSTPLGELEHLAQVAEVVAARVAAIAAAASDATTKANAAQAAATSAASADATTKAAAARTGAVADVAAAIPDSGTAVGSALMTSIAGLAFDPNDVGYDVWLLAGQSNNVGYSVGDPSPISTLLDATDPRVMQWPGSGTYFGLGRPILAADQLAHHQVPVAGSVGPGLTFGKEYARRIKPNRRVLLVPCAHGGTGFTTSSLVSPPVGYTTAAGGGWDPSGNQGGINLYEFAVAQANAALAYSPNNRFAGVIWVQGEADSGLTGSAYTALQDALEDGFRTRITGAANSLFLIGQMVPEGLDADAGRKVIGDTQIETPSRRVLTAFSYGARGYNDGLATPLHYTNEGQRLNGLSLAAAVDLAVANVLHTNPITPGTVYLLQSGTTVRATWLRTPGRVTDYNVRYSVNGGSWTNLTRAQSIDVTASITGMTTGNTVEVEVRSVNDEGVSAWTSAASITLVKVPGQPTLALGTPTAGTMPYTITAPTVDSSHSAATSYLLEYKLHAAGSWTTFATVTALTGSVTGLTDSSQYDVRATANNAAGAGTASTTQTAYTAAPTNLLDDVGVTAYRAYGLRKLRAAYTGYAIQVRRTSDNTTQDIGFATGTNNLDTAAMTTFAAGSSLRVVKWYDQSGNARDLTQSTTGRQPRIMNAGTLDTDGGKPTLVFAGTADFSDASVGLWAAGHSSWLAVVKASSGTLQWLWSERGSATPGRTTVYADAAGVLSSLIANDAGTTQGAGAGGSVATGALAQASAVDTGTNLSTWVNGTAGGNSAYTRAGTTTVNTFSLGALVSGGSPSSPWLGNLSEMIFFDAALTTGQRQAGQTSQKTYFGTP